MALHYGVKRYGEAAVCERVIPSGIFGNDVTHLSTDVINDDNDNDNKDNNNTNNNINNGNDNNNNNSVVSNNNDKN